MTTPPIELLSSWCDEAVREFGDDWPRIQNFLQTKLSELPEPERTSIAQSMSLMLADPDCARH